MGNLKRRIKQLIPGYASLDILSRVILGYPNLRFLYRDIPGYPDLPRVSLSSFQMLLYVQFRSSCTSTIYDWNAGDRDRTLPWASSGHVANDRYQEALDLRK